MVEKDYIEVGTTTPMVTFNKKISAKMLEYNKKHLPFDEPCARLEFRDKLENAEKESERRHGFIKLDEIKIEIGDLEEYGKPDRFELVEEQDAYIDKVLEGSRTQVIMGKTMSYVCKARGHRIAVFIPQGEEGKKFEVKDIKQK